MELNIKWNNKAGGHSLFLQGWVGHPIKDFIVPTPHMSMLPVRTGKPEDGPSFMKLH